MKIQLEQSAVNISKLMGSKKLDGGLTLKTLVTYVLRTGNIEGKSK